MEDNTMATLNDTDEQTMNEHDGDLIEYDWNSEVRYGGSAPLTPDEAEDAWNAPADEADPAADAHADNQSSESYRLKHLGREFDVTRDEIIRLAQKGVDYDRIRDRADRLRDSIKQRDASEMAAMSEAERRREQETREFIKAYGSVKPEDIPQEVWSEVAGGKPLLSAYQSYENRTLRMQLEAERREAQNRIKSTGPRPTLGAQTERGELEADWYRD